MDSAAHSRRAHGPLAAALPTPGRRLALAACMALTACTVLAGCMALQDPPSRADLQRDALSNLKTPPQWTGAPVQAEPVGDSWLASFGDPTLVALVTESLTYNADLAVAASRVEQSVAAVKIAGGALVPAVGAFARGGSKLSGDLSGLQGVGLTAVWEIDVWGRVRYGQRAAQDVYASAQADFEFARQSIAAHVSKAWFLAIEATRQLALARDTVAAAERVRVLAEERQRVGIGSEVDVALAAANANALRDSARGIEAARLQSLRALETLLGQYPAATALVPAQWQPMPPAASAGLPSELLERRPDVVAAERRVAAAWDRVGEARAARLPKLSLTAGISSISSDLFVLQDFDNPAITLGVNLLWPIFQGGALEGVQELRTAEQKQAVAAWAQAGLRAFGEVENALANEAALIEREKILQAAVRDAQRALELEEVRYRVGSRDLRTVLQQQIALYATQMSLLRVQADMRVQRVNLYLALGGGFEPPPAAARP